MYGVTEHLKRDIQNIELEMLIAVDAICRQLEIDYFLVGGTLLGAVRHKGFIPWDDDIDIGMMRSDYEKFINNAQEMLPSGLFLQSLSTELNCPFNFAKIRNCNTTYIETSVKEYDINHGIFIDVFPFDYYSESKYVINKKRIILSLSSRKICNSFYTEKKLAYTKLGRVANMVSDMVFKDVRTALLARECVYKSVHQTSLVTNYSGAWGKREIVPAEWISRYVDLEFEGHLFKAPKEYDKYLKNVYGNYMELPPKEKRVGHHYAEVIDPSKSYKCYRK